MFWRRYPDSPLIPRANHGGRKREVDIRELKSVGMYAAKIVFDDGHDTGLYT